MDRNNPVVPAKNGDTVALRKESVDRNVHVGNRELGALLSLSARRAWIEMPGCAGRPRSGWVALRKESVDRNFHQPRNIVDTSVSLSARRAWIEILRRWRFAACCPSLSARRAWIEILCGGSAGAGLIRSLSARRAWIEIGESNRNSARRDTVALRKESVDRNKYWPDAMLWSLVALRKESVDRNISIWNWTAPAAWSLSARRAWIEIVLTGTPRAALWSLSARRAWIEI